MSNDVVAELDHWLAVWPNHLAGSIDLAVVQRARDELVALREAKLARPSAYDIVRDQALEEAARVCEEPARRLREELGWSAEAELLARYAGAIRALKDKGR